MPFWVSRLEISSIFILCTPELRLRIIPGASSIFEFVFTFIGISFKNDAFKGTKGLLEATKERWLLRIHNGCENKCNYTPFSLL